MNYFTANPIITAVGVSSGGSGGGPMVLTHKMGEVETPRWGNPPGCKGDGDQGALGI